MTLLAYLVFNLDFFCVVSQGLCVPSWPGDKYHTENEMEHVDSGFQLSSIRLPCSHLSSHCTEGYLYKAPTSSSCFAEVHIMQCWTKICPSVNKTCPCQDFLAWSDGRATAERSLSPSRAWATWQPFLTPPHGPFSVVWKQYFTTWLFFLIFLL